MKTVHNLDQRGSTLPIAMILLVAITLLVVFAIRAGNTNLRIAGNTQAQTEASAAAQEAIERTIEKIVEVDNPSLIPGQEVVVAMGAKTYTAIVKPLSNCVVEEPIPTSELKTSNPNDIPCFGSNDPDRAVLDTGELSALPPQCKKQQWEINAQVKDDLTGAEVEHVQGVSIRVPSVVTCL